MNRAGADTDNIFAQTYRFLNCPDARSPRDRQNNVSSLCELRLSQILSLVWVRPATDYGKKQVDLGVDRSRAVHEGGFHYVCHRRIGISADETDNKVPIRSG